MEKGETNLIYGILRATYFLVNVKSKEHILQGHTLRTISSSNIYHDTEQVTSLFNLIIYLRVRGDINRGRHKQGEGQREKMTPH